MKNGQKEMHPRNMALLLDRVQNDTQAQKRVARELRNQVIVRLREWPDLRGRLRQEKLRLRQIEEGGVPMRKQVVQRFQRSGVRLTEEQIYNALVADLRARIAAEEFAVMEIQMALEEIEDDPYYPVISRRYFDGWDDEAIGTELQIQPSTLRKHRVRLLDRLVVLLYGATDTRRETSI